MTASMAFAFVGATLASPASMLGAISDIIGLPGRRKRRPYNGSTEGLDVVDA